MDSPVHFALFYFISIQGWIKLRRSFVRRLFIENLVSLCRFREHATFGLSVSNYRSSFGTNGVFLIIQFFVSINENRYDIQSDSKEIKTAIIVIKAQQFAVYQEKKKSIFLSTFLLKKHVLKNLDLTQFRNIL